MKNKSKKILSLVTAAMLLGATAAMSACKDSYYDFDGVSYKATNDKAVSNGGFAVEKGDYVYFINGVEDYTAENEFGEVTKGALMRVKKSDLSGAFANDGSLADKAEVVVPMLFVSQNYEAGIFIYGDYVYYATPTIDKNMKGEVENTWIDFKRARLDGKETMKDCYFRLSDNTANYRFVEEGGKVYCLYEEDSALKSFNTETKETTVLVSGASSDFFFDTKDPENANVYYTMGVTYNIDSDQSSTASYNQVYCVNAASTATVNAKEASYTVKVNGKTYRTYDFDKGYLETKNDEAKATAKKNNTKAELPYDFDDYSTYPYVNLGTLVLDGVGSESPDSPYNNATEKTTARAELSGYTYTITRYENGGVYYTREETVEKTNLYYLQDGAATNAVAANANPTVVAESTTNASDSALFRIENGVHEYFYVSGSKIYKTSRVNGEDVEIELTNDASGATLWQIRGDYLYYYGSGTSGNNLSRIKIDGTADDYKTFMNQKEYQPITIAYIDWNSSWYKPEFVGGVLLYCDAQQIGGESYNYIAAANVGENVTRETLVAENEAYTDVQDKISEYSENSELQDLMTYYFRTGAKTALTTEVWDLYSKDYQQAKFNEFADAIGKGEYRLESSFVKAVGKVNDEDKEAIETAWKESLLSPEEEDEDEDDGMATWLICVLVGAAVIVVAAAIVIPVVIVNKKSAERRRREAIVNAGKRHDIDIKDDNKEIDVYATDNSEQVSAETVAAPETASEEVSAETVEAPETEEAPETANAEVSETETANGEETADN